MVQLRGKGDSSMADSFRHGVHWRRLSDYQPAAEPSVWDRGNTALSLSQWLPQPLLIPIMEVTSWHLPGQTRGLWLAGLRHRPWQQHIFSSFNLSPDARQSGGEWVRPGPDVWAHVEYSTPPPAPMTTAQASSYALICPDGKWAYCMWGSQGFMLVNGKLKGFQCTLYLQLTRIMTKCWVSLVQGWAFDSHLISAACSRGLTT